MDPLTHGLLGATIGQALFARRLGGGALLAGAAAAMARGPSRRPQKAWPIVAPSRP